MREPERTEPEEKRFREALINHSFRLCVETRSYTFNLIDVGYLSLLRFYVQALRHNANPKESIKQRFLKERDVLMTSTYNRRSFLKGAALASVAAGAGLLGSTTMALADEAVEAAGVEPAWDAEAEVVVVGFGGSGSVAALTASEQGSSVYCFGKGCSHRWRYFRRVWRKRMRRYRRRQLL